MRTACARLRKSEQAVTPVIATILMVAITVVLAAVLYALVTEFMDVKGPGKYVNATVDDNQNNWTIDIIGIVNGPIMTNDVHILVKKVDGSVGLVSTLVSEMTAGAYYNGVRFIDSTSSGTLDASDGFTLDKAIYKTGSEITLLSGDEQSVYGTFRV